MAEYICPHCKKPNYDDDALSCVYCGESLERGIGFMGKIKYPTPKVIIIIAITVVLASFIALVLL